MRGAVRRREDPRLITGAGEFVDDLRVPGLPARGDAALAARARAHPRDRRGGGAPARPGVVGVFVAADLGAAGAPMPIYAPHPALPVPCRISAAGRAIACASWASRWRWWSPTIRTARSDALDLIRVEYEPLPAVVDVEAALAPGAPIVHEEVGSNVVAEWRQRVGDADAALARRAGGRADARPAGAGRRASARAARPGRALGRTTRLTVWGAVQMVHRHRGVIAGQLGAARGARAGDRAARRGRRASAPRACTTPSTSRWPSWRGGSAGP